MRKSYIFPIIISILISGNVSAFDNKKTHPIITDEAIDIAEINQYLEDNLNLANGVETPINGLKITRWLRDGSKLEDVPNCRASNHFHNPLRDWTASGMRDEPWFIDWWCSESEYPPNNIKSAVHWATGYSEPSPDGVKPGTNNQWDWDHSREYYYIYLTGKDYDGNVVADTEEQRKRYFADSFQAVGQVLHVLQDMAVPAHVRNDFKSHLDFHGITWETLFHSIEKTQGDIT